MGLIAKLDTLSKPKNLPRTTVGGMIVILTYCFVVIMFLIYVITVSSAEYPREVSVKAFPGKEDSDVIYMPTMKCVSTSGCYIRPAAAVGISSDGFGCIFVDKGQALPQSHLRLHFNSDAFEYFSVLSKDPGLNFALSYEFEKVTRYSDPLETDVTAAATALDQAGASAYKLFRGVSVMNLIRTKGISETVDSWGAATTSSVSIQDNAGSSINCKAADIKDINGIVLYYGNDPNHPINNCYSGSTWQPNLCWTTSVQAATTYTEITVLNPLEAGTVLGLVGGWIGLMGTVGVLLFAGYKQVFGDPRDETEGEGEKSTEMTAPAPSKI